MNTKKSHIAFGFLTPWIIKLGVFWIYPLFYALYMSFTRYRALGNTSEFIGFDNYATIGIDPLFWKALSNTIIYAFGAVPLSTACALILAILLHSKLARFPGFYRAGLFLPSVTAINVITLIFTNLYAKDGYINALAGMIGLPQTAQLQGANAWQMFYRITLPLMKPTLLFVMVISTIKSLQIFVEMYTMTKGGPLNSTITVVYLIFSNAFEKTDAMGYGAALAYVLFAIIGLLSFIQMKLLGNKE